MQTYRSNEMKSLYTIYPKMYSRCLEFMISNNDQILDDSIEQQIAKSPNTVIIINNISLSLKSFEEHDL